MEIVKEEAPVCLPTIASSPRIFPSLLQPQLTTIDFKVDEIGIIAANKLIDKINYIKLKKKIFDVGIELIKGGSAVNQKKT